MSKTRKTRKLLPEEKLFQDIELNEHSIKEIQRLISPKKLHDELRLALEHTIDDYSFFLLLKGGDKKEMHAHLKKLERRADNFLESLRCNFDSGPWVGLQDSVEQQKAQLALHWALPINPVEADKTIKDILHAVEQTKGLVDRAKNLIEQSSAYELDGWFESQLEDHWCNITGEEKAGGDNASRFADFLRVCFRLAGNERDDAEHLQRKGAAYRKSLKAGENPNNASPFANFLRANW